MERVPEEPGWLHRETLSQNKQTNKQNAMLMLVTVYKTHRTPNGDRPFLHFRLILK